MKIVCVIKLYFFIESVTECALCQAIISQIDKLLDNSKNDTEIEEVVKKVCEYLPTDKQNEVIFYFTIFFEKSSDFKLKFKSVQCNKMVEIYGQSIINMFKDHVDPEKMCSKMALCSSSDYFAMSFKNPRSLDDLKNVGHIERVQKRGDREIL